MGGPPLGGSERGSSPGEPTVQMALRSLSGGAGSWAAAGAQGPALRGPCWVTCCRHLGIPNDFTEQPAGSFSKFQTYRHRLVSTAHPEHLTAGEGGCSENRPDSWGCGANSREPGAAGPRFVISCTKFES